MAEVGTADEIDGIAWQFLCSPFTRRDYWDWPLERRIDAYLRHLQGAEPGRPRFLATADREEASRVREAGVAVGVLLPHEWALWVG